MFDEINRSWGKFYLANILTLGFYGYLYVIIKAQSIGKLVQADYPGPWKSALFTLLTLLFYPLIMLSVLAYKIAPVTSPSLGHAVLVFNLASCITALVSGGLFLVISTLLWTQAVWLLADSAERAMIYRTSGFDAHASEFMREPQR